jgi:hypothetical protein
MMPLSKPRSSRVEGRELKVFLIAVAILSTAACQPPVETLALQCITGSAVWNPLVLDPTQPSIGGHSAVVTDSDIGWQTITRNGFGGATHTQYELSRASGTVTVENIYVDPKGNRATQPVRYAGECFARHRSF